jgi:hypothetical protein
MKLFRYSDFLNESNEDIDRSILALTLKTDSICKKWGIKNYTVKEGLVNVHGDVNLSVRELTKLPLKFGEVSGDFHCHYNQLTSLEGAPTRVGGDFDCSDNRLANLEGAPEVVEKEFYCSNNKLTTLKGGSKVRGTRYGASNNQLINFYGFPEDGWEGSVDFSGNPVGEILDLFPRERWCEAIDWIVEFDVLYSTVVPFMYLEAVFERMNLPVPEDKIYNLKNYEII